jgi:vacuolar-type H+-ATPase subunit E/Vma4
MSLQIILEKIRSIGEAQVQEIEKNAQAQANKILAEARLEANRLEEETCDQVSAPAIAERARILHRARLEAMSRIGNAREELVDTALARLEERLVSIRSDPLYPVILRFLVEEAIEALKISGARQIKVLADRRDKTLLNDILTEQAGKITINYVLHCWGGIIAKSEDECITVFNTLEARLEQARPFLRRYLAAIFETEQPALKSVSANSVL